MTRKIRGKKFVYWKHPTAKNKYVKARRFKSGRVKIVDVIPSSKVPKKKK